MKKLAFLVISLATFFAANALNQPYACCISVGSDITDCNRFESKAECNAKCPGICTPVAFNDPVDTSSGVHVSLSPEERQAYRKLLRLPNK